MSEAFRRKLNNLIDRHEGDRLTVYRCPAGARTIGRGWNIDANPLPKAIREYLAKNGRITPEMSDELMIISIDRAISDCYRLFPEFDKFSDNRRLALIDFVFQLGLTTARTFIHTIAAINRQHWEDAAERMRESRWAEQVPKRAEEITEMIEEG